MPAGPGGTGGGLRDSLVDVLLEFLETLIHQVLFVRELYSPELFERRRAYGIATRRARHPELVSYIEDAVNGLRGPLASGTLARVAVVVLRPDRSPAERFVVEPRVLSGASAGGGTEAALDVGAVEAQLRGVLLKLQYCDAYLARLPPGCTFEVAAYTSAARGGPGAPPPDAWVEEQPRGGHLELARTEIVPIKSCTLEGSFQLQLYAES